VFTSRAEPKCAICHTLAAAGAAGELGPDLDEARPSEEKVRAAVNAGFEAMPPYAEKLTADEIDAVAAYVAAVAGRAE
jgi:mono/diheme cytochrome c family protein